VLRTDARRRKPIDDGAGGDVKLVDVAVLVDSRPEVELIRIEVHGEHPNIGRFVGRDWIALEDGAVGVQPIDVIAACHHNFAVLANAQRVAHAGQARD
jgi:hypothetical protein